MAKDVGACLTKPSSRNSGSDGNFVATAYGGVIRLGEIRDISSI